MNGSRLAAALCAALLAPALAGAQTFPARSGESGLIDVPDAEIIPRGVGLLAGELRLDQRTSGPADFGPLPLYVVGGFSRRVETGLTMREWGQPGDPLPERILFGGAVKVQLLKPTLRVPGLAVDLTADRVNSDAVLGSRLIFSTRSRGAFRLAAFAGGEAGPDSGFTWGAALGTAVAPATLVIVEALGGPRGQNYGAAVRWRATSFTSMSVGLNWLPDDSGFRLSVGFAFGQRTKQAAPSADPAAAAPAAGPAAAAAAPAAIAFAEDRPRFRLKLRIFDPTSADPRSLRHGPWTASAAAAPGGPGGAAARPAAATRPAAASLEDLAEAQLHDQEALADTRERRVRSTAEQLAARDAAAQAEARRLEELEGEVAAREQQLEARERRLPRGGVPSQQQRDLESVEAQLAAQDRNLAAQERSYAPALDAAAGRERDAGAREDAERAEASRLAASVSGAGTRAQQLEIRKQALGARTRQLAALEARLVARGERIDAVERQLRSKAERLDVAQRRLDARSERLDLLESRAAGPKGATPAQARPVQPRADQAPKDKAVFVMVVKSPTAIVKERGAAPAAPAAPVGVQPGVAVEKAVAAATVVTFASPAAQLSELDRETIDNIAKLAAREGCELLIWARAKDPSLMSEAQRRAAEIKTRAISVAQLAERQVVTRITTRPGATGVDVVVSALRESAKPSSGAAAAAAAGRPAGNALEAGEAGKRQIREAVQAAQPSIEACVADVMEARKLARAEGTMRLTISAAGKVTKVLTSGADLEGSGLAECLGGSSGSWSFPHADAEYSVDVPITVIRGGAPR